MLESQKFKFIDALANMVRRKHVGLELKYESYGTFCRENYVRFRVQSNGRDNNGNCYKRGDSDELFDYLKKFIALLEIDETKFQVSFNEHSWNGSDGYSYYHTCHIRNKKSFSDPDRNLSPINLLGYKLLGIHKKLREIKILAECKAVHIERDIDSLNSVINMVGTTRKIQNKLKEKKEERDKIIYEYYDEVIEKKKKVWPLED